jgi:hypothetical protein
MRENIFISCKYLKRNIALKQEKHDFYDLKEDKNKNVVPEKIQQQFEADFFT